MAPVNRLDGMRASLASIPHRDRDLPDDDAFELDDFEAELKRLSAVNQELMHDFQPEAEAPSLGVADGDELALLRLENDELKARVQELEAIAAGQGEDLWVERQREYETLLEEKSEVIRNLHQRIQEIQESAISSAPAASSAGASSTKLGQAEEILRLKREMEEQRRQLERDEEEMMGQMRQMELTMAKERAEMARQRQEVQRLQADLTREIETSSRDSGLRDRLQSLRRPADSKQTPVPTPIPAAVKQAAKDQQSSGLLRRIFG